MSVDPPDRPAPGAPIDTSLVETQIVGLRAAPEDELLLPSVVETVASSKLDTVRDPGGAPGNAVAPGAASAMSRLRIDDADELARGGMGTIHRVNDPGIRRWVALKRVDAQQARMTPEIAHLLLEEAQITGQLEHPNIVPIYDVGFDTDGLPMFTMKLVEGQTLTALISASDRRGGHTADQLRAILDVFIRVCDAIAFAHSRGVIHRDLKPDNIMVGEFGQVYVVDWGCALIRRRSDTPPDKRVTIESPGKARGSPEAVLGTAAYMAPEQARGWLDTLDERVDVFSLGGILYHALTRRPPHRGRDWAQQLQLAQTGEVTPPSQLRLSHEVPGELADIAMKAMAVVPQERYQSVIELRDAVQAFLVRGSWFPRRRFTAGHVIIAEGDHGDAAYLIVAGSCQASRVIRGVVTPIRQMEAGEIFGETAILTDQPRSATVTALTDVTVTVITREAIESELAGASWIGTLVRALAERFREAERRADAATDG